MTHEIVEAKPHHVGAMIHRMRTVHRDEITAIGIDPHRELRRVFNDSSFHRACFLDGRIVALWGVTGPLMASMGYVWLVLSNDVTRLPVSIVKEARRQLDDIMRTKIELATTVLGNDKAAQRFAIFLGFHFGHDAVSGPAHTRRMRRTLKERLDSDPDLRIPIGNGYAIALGYHAEGAL